MFRSLLIVLLTIAFLPSLVRLVMGGVMGIESAGMMLILIVFLLVLARRFMQYVMPAVAILIFLWASSGSDPGAFTVLLSQILSLGIMLLWFAHLFRLITGRRD